MRRMASLLAAGTLLASAADTACADDGARPVIPADEYVFCTVCHGVDMGGNVVIEAPRLSGMDTWYVERQLRAFRDDWRGTHDSDANGQEMRPMAAALSDAQIAEVAAYVKAVSSPPPALTVDGDVTRGEALYATCAGCHGAAAEGNEALGGPALTGLNDWYLVEQLEKYRAGLRGSHPDDRYGQQMKAATALLPDKQATADVVRYISTLRSKDSLTGKK